MFECLKCFGPRYYATKSRVHGYHKETGIVTLRREGRKDKCGPEYCQGLMNWVLFCRVSMAPEKSIHSHECNIIISDFYNSSRSEQTNV